MFLYTNQDSDVIAASMKELRSRRVIPFMGSSNLESLRLTNYIRETGLSLTEPEVLAIIQDLEKAYSYLKEHGIVHGAINKDNVFVEKVSL